jgi:hypothetical protein
LFSLPAVGSVADVPGLKPGERVSFDVRAEARTYLRCKGNGQGKYRGLSAAPRNRPRGFGREDGDPRWQKQVPRCARNDRQKSKSKGTSKSKSESESESKGTSKNKNKNKNTSTSKSNG